MACKNCKYFDENETSGGRGYCEWYKTYYYPDDNCSHFTKRDSDGCFLTSACCNYKGLPDDCKELTVLRHFRDNYLRKLDSGEAIINEYYRIAPTIVERIDASDDKENVYCGIYETIIKCVELYEKEEYKIILELYMQMVNNLKEKYIEGISKNEG